MNDLGSCRLCLVEVEGCARLLPACRTKAAEGMVVETETPKLAEHRRTMLRLILSNHRAACMSCPENGACRLQALCNRYGIEEAGITGARMEIEEKLPVLEDHPYLRYDPSKCIHCFRCVSACHFRAGAPGGSRSRSSRQRNI